MRKKKFVFYFRKLNGSPTDMPFSSRFFLPPLLGGIGLALLNLAPPAIVAQEKAEDPPVEAEPSKAGEEAVKRVRNLGFRLTSRDKDPGENAGAPGSTPEDIRPPSTGEPSQPGPMNLGRVQENVSLPPEVAEIAKEGALAVADGDWERARDLYLKMVKAAPDNALAYANLGVAEHQLGNLLAAAGNLGKSTTLNPHIARNWQTLGLIHYQRGELALALSCLTRAVHEAPDDAETRVILAAVARDYGWPGAALTELQRAVEIDPKNASAQYNLAITYLEADPPRLELARRHYYAAIDLGTSPSQEIETILKPGE